MSRLVLVALASLAALSAGCAEKQTDAERAAEDALRQVAPEPTTTAPTTSTTIDPATEALKARLANAEATAPYNACAYFAVKHIVGVSGGDTQTRYAPGYWETDKFSFARSGSNGFVIKSNVYFSASSSAPYECLVSPELPDDRRQGYEIHNGFTLVAFESASYTDGVVP